MSAWTYSLKIASRRWFISWSFQSVFYDGWQFLPAVMSVADCELIMGHYCTLYLLPPPPPPSSLPPFSLSGWAVVNLPLPICCFLSHPHVSLPAVGGHRWLVRVLQNSRQRQIPSGSHSGTMWWVRDLAKSLSSWTHLHSHVLASPLCPLLFFTLSWKKPPHWVMQIVLMIGAFVMSIAWLNVIANEVVSVLQAMGLLVGISTGTSICIFVEKRVCRHHTSQVAIIITTQESLFV